MVVHSTTCESAVAYLFVEAPSTVHTLSPHSEFHCAAYNNGCSHRTLAGSGSNPRAWLTDGRSSDGAD